MAKYRVITIAMTVKNNRIANFNQIVDDSELTTNPSLLIEGGFIELVEEDDVIDIESDVVETEEVISLKKSVETAEQALADLPKDASKEKIDEAKKVLKDAKLALKESSKK